MTDHLYAGSRGRYRRLFADRAYREMASDERREAEAADWAEATVSDIAEVQLGLS